MNLPNILRFPTCLKGLAASLSSSVPKNHYDIVVVGGGMVGFGFTAMAASHPMLQNKRILLLEGGPKKLYKRTTNFKNRVVALTPISRKLLNDIGAWQHIENERYQVVKRMKIFENGNSSNLLLERSNPSDAMGYIIENDSILTALAKCVDKSMAECNSEKRPGSVEVMYNAVVENYVLPSAFNDSEFPQLTISTREASNDKQHISTSLLVGADGFTSNVREAASVHTISWQHDQCGLVANLNLPDDYDCTTAWQRFVASGPIALLPVDSHNPFEYIGRQRNIIDFKKTASDNPSPIPKPTGKLQLGPNKCSVTWSTTKSEAKRLLAIDEEAFVTELNRLMSGPSHQPSGVVAALTDTLKWAINIGKDALDQHQFTPPRILSIDSGSRAAFPLSFSHCTFYHAPRVALIGDAAHRILPLTGQGVNMGFGDAASLAEKINLALADGADLATPSYLREYTSDRQRSVVPMAAFVEGLQLLYTTDCTFPKDTNREVLKQISSSLGLTDAFLSLRGLGVDLLNSSGSIKKFFIEGAVNGRLGLSSSK